MLDLPPSPRNNFHASFLPPPPDIPDNRENARTAHRRWEPPTDIGSDRQMKARGRGVSQGWDLSSTQQRVQVRGFSPAESFRERAPSCTMRSVWHGSASRAWGVARSVAIFLRMDRSRRLRPGRARERRRYALRPGPDAARAGRRVPVRGSRAARAPSGHSCPCAPGALLLRGRARACAAPRAHRRGCRAASAALLPRARRPCTPPLPPRRKRSAYLP